MDPNGRIQLALCRLVLGQGARDCPPTPVMVPPWVRDPRAKAQETLPHKVLP